MFSLSVMILEHLAMVRDYSLTDHGCPKPVPFTEPRSLFEANPVIAELIAQSLSLKCIVSIYVYLCSWEFGLSAVGCHWFVHIFNGKTPAEDYFLRFHGHFQVFM